VLHGAEDEWLDLLAAFQRERDDDRHNRLTEMPAERAIVVRRRIGRLARRRMSLFLAVRAAVMAATTAACIAARLRRRCLIMLPMRVSGRTDDRISAQQRERQQRDQGSESLHGEILHSAGRHSIKTPLSVNCNSIAYLPQWPVTRRHGTAHRNESNFSARGCLIDAFAIVWQNGMREAIVRGMNSDIFPATECPNQFSNR
jgi:hypothetical protein